MIFTTDRFYEFFCNYKGSALHCIYSTMCACSQERSKQGLLLKPSPSQIFLETLIKVMPSRTVQRAF